MSSEQPELHADDHSSHSTLSRGRAFHVNDSHSLASDHGFSTIPDNTVSISGNQRPQSLDAEEDYAQRPRFPGNDSTYRHFIAEEQQLYDSLEQLQSWDLSIHLFNAHSRRVRARQIRNEKTEESATSEVEVWEPPRDWAKWPLEADVVPREHTEGWSRLPDEERWYRKPGPELSSRQVLEELLISIASRRARQTFDAREWHSSSSRGSEIDVHLESAGVETAEGGHVDTDQVEPDESMSSSDSSTSSASKDQSRRGSGSTEVGFRSHQRVLYQDSSESSSDEESDSQVPVSMTDDSQIAILLRKPARHLLFQLDRVLAGLHHARQAQLQRDDDSQTDSDQDTNDERRDITGPTDPLTSEVGMRSRSSRHSMLSKSISSSESNFSSPLSSEEFSDRAHSTESKESEKPSTSRSSRGRSISRRRSRSGTRYSASSSSQNYKEANRSYVPRDWSDVLGMAAVTGWDVDAVKRAQMRCERLFGEKMEIDDVDVLGNERTMTADLNIEGQGGDEIQDGVHVDGFLQTIKTRRGWRGRDFQQRVKKGKKAENHTAVNRKQKRGRPRKKISELKTARRVKKMKEL